MVHPRHKGRANLRLVHHRATGDERADFRALIGREGAAIDAGGEGVLECNILLGLHMVLSDLLRQEGGVFARCEYAIIYI